MKRLASFALAAFSALSAFAEPDTTNTVMMVDQYGKLNVEGVASVEDVATNAVRVQIAETAASTAMSTARSVTNQLNGIVANIMANNVVVYRSGYTDSFEGLVVYTTNDTLMICGYTKVSLTDQTLVSQIDYVCTVDIGAVKPTVMAHDTVTNLANFTQVPAASVVGPVIHNESKTIANVTYSKWYSITVTTTVEGDGDSYFYFIQLDADTPSGDGTTLDLPNGVTDGKTATVTWGDKTLTFVGGVLTGVTQNAAD